MKRILITAKQSYIGNAFAAWTAEKYHFDYISCRTNGWKDQDFSKYDVIFHVAGIAHISTDPNMRSEYYKVNKDLTIELANKAKADGVKQFIFMSSIIVYGDSSSINKRRVINRTTIPSPSNFYGDSKLKAEEGILPMQSNRFNVVVIRPPMVYGENSKGNYPTLVKIALKLPLFPDIDNKRSVIHIDNLSEFIRLMVDNEEKGVFFPQNAENVCTSEMVRLIAEAHGKRIRMTKIANPLLSFLGKKIGVVNKAFGSLIYDKSMSVYKENYCVRDLKQSIKVTEI